METPLLSTTPTATTPATSESNEATVSEVLESASVEFAHEEHDPEGCEQSSTTSDDSGFELGPLIHSVDPETIIAPQANQNVHPQHEESNTAPARDPTGGSLIEEETPPENDHHEHSQCYILCSFIGRHGTYILGALFGLATALIDWEAAWQYAQYQKEIIWMNRIVLWNWSIMKILDVTATTFYMLCGISEAVFDWKKNYYCVDFLIVFCFFWGAAFDLASSLLDQKEGPKWRARWSIHTESISVALFFSSALIQMIVNRKRYRGCRANVFAMAIFIADACFLSGTCVDWVVNGMEEREQTLLAFGAFSHLDDEGGSSEYNDAQAAAWLQETSWAIVSAILWFLNSAISATVEVLDKDHQALEAVLISEAVDYEPPDIV